MKRRKWDVAAPQGVAGNAAAPQPTSAVPLMVSPAPTDTAGAAEGVHPTAYGMPGLVAAPCGVSVAPLAAQIPPGKGMDQEMVRRIQAQAAAVASRLNQDAVARGVVSPQAPLQVPDPAAAAAAQAALLQQQQQVAAQAALLQQQQAAAAQAVLLQQQQAAAAQAAAHIRTEVTFNNSAPRMRHQLTKRSTQQELEAKWRVVVVVRGRYCPPGAQPPSEYEEDRPLFLRITPSNTLPMDPQWRQHACDMCAADITAIITGRPRPMPKPPGAAGAAPGAAPAYPGAAPGAAAPTPAPAGAAPATAGAHPTSGPGWLCLYVRCDSAPPEFDTAGRLRGPNGSYLQHIQSATGAVATVVGLGSGTQPEAPKPLHLCLVSQEAAQLEEGRRLAANLIDTIRDDFRTVYPALPAPPLAGQYEPPPLPKPTAPSAAPAPAPWQQHAAQQPTAAQPGGLFLPAQQQQQQSQQAGEHASYPSLPLQHDSQNDCYHQQQQPGAQMGTYLPPPQHPPPPPQQHPLPLPGYYAPPYGGGLPQHDPQQRQQSGYYSQGPYAGYGGGYAPSHRAPRDPGSPFHHGSHHHQQQQGQEHQPKQQERTAPEEYQPPAKRRFTEAKASEGSQGHTNNPYYQYQQARSSEQHRGALPPLPPPQAQAPPLQSQPLGAMGPSPARFPRHTGAVLPGMDAYAD